MDKPILVTREQLYAQVWTTPTQTLAKQYGISDVGLGKICRRLNVPKPGLGYWARVEAGEHPPKTPLPGRSLQQSYEIRPRPPVSVETEEQRQERERRERLTMSFAGVSVPDVLSNPHPLTRKTKEHFDAIRKRLEKRKSPRQRSSFDGPQLADLPFNQKGRYECKVGSGFPLVVSLTNLDRALRILDTWTKEVIALGFELRADEKKNELSACKDGQQFRLGLREGYRKREFSADERKGREAARQYPYDYEWVGSGKFTLTISGPIYRTHREWVEGKKPLQSRLPEMLAEIVELVPLAKRLREEQEREEKKHAEEERRRWQEQARREEEKQQLDALVTAAEQTARAQKALHYLDQLEAALVRSEGTLSMPIVRWLTMSREIARKADPLPRWVEELRGLRDGAPEDTST